MTMDRLVSSSGKRGLRNWNSDIAASEFSKHAHNPSERKVVATHQTAGRAKGLVAEFCVHDVHGGHHQDLLQAKALVSDAPHQTPSSSQDCLFPSIVNSPRIITPGGTGFSTCVFDTPRSSVSSPAVSPRRWALQCSNWILE